MDFVLTSDHVKAMLREESSVEAAAWHVCINKIFPRFGIASAKQVAMFMSLYDIESKGFTILEENLNISKEDLCTAHSSVFGFVRNSSSEQAGSASGIDAVVYHYQPEKIANVIYANTLGNGVTASGDGWKYRGRGVRLLRGKTEYTSFGTHGNVGRSADDVVAYLQTKDGALAAACWHWEANNMNALADADNIAAATLLVTGSETIGARANLFDTNEKILAGNASATNKALGDASTLWVQGDEGDPIYKIQLAICKYADGTDLEFPQFTCDGIFGSSTLSMVKKYQAEMGLAQTGILKPAALKDLGLI